MFIGVLSSVQPAEVRDRQAGGWVGRHVGWQAGRQAGRLAGRLADRLAGWQTARLAGRGRLLPRRAIKNSR